MPTITVPTRSPTLKLFVSKEALQAEEKSCATEGLPVSFILGMKRWIGQLGFLSCARVGLMRAQITRFGL